MPEGRGPWADRTDIARVNVPLGDVPRRGGDRPLVELVVFSDFECPHCTANAAVLERLRQSHPSSVRVHHRHLPLPFHRHAEAAAQAAEEARAQGGDDAFWRMHDQLFSHPGALEPDDLAQYAEEIGLDVVRFRDALERQVHAPAIERDIELADEVGADGAPTMYLNGRPIYGALPYPQLAMQVDEEVALARAALGQGIPREHLYTVAMRNARDARDAEPAPPPRAPARGERLDPTVEYAVPIEGAPRLGRPDALVTIVMFSDFQCPFCARAMPTLGALIERYGEDLAIVFRHNPLPSHPAAYGAAEASAEAFAQGGDRAFWRMHDVLLRNPGALSREDLLGYAREQGLDADRLGAALDGGTHQEAIEDDRALAARFGARVTPSFFVNGRPILGAQPLGAFVDLVDTQLAAARARVEAGTPRTEVYAAIVAEGAAEARYTSNERPEHVELAVPEGAPRRGASEPAVVVQMFSDFQCPYCRDVQPTIARLIEEHPEVQVAFRHYPLPFHRDARPTSMAAIEVQRQLGDEAFWRFHDRALEADSLERDSLVAIAAELGADPEAVGAAIDQERYAEIVDADVAAVRNAGLRIGTPAFVVGNRLVMGAQPYRVFDLAVREAAVPAAD